MPKKSASTIGKRLFSCDCWRPKGAQHILGRTVKYLGLYAGASFSLLIPPLAPNFPHLLAGRFFPFVCYFGNASVTQARHIVELKPPEFRSEIPCDELINAIYFLFRSAFICHKIWKRSVNDPEDHKLVNISEAKYETEKPSTCHATPARLMRDKV